MSGHSFIFSRTALQLATLANDPEDLHGAIRDERCTVASLEFLATAEVGLRGRKARHLARDEDDGEERTGEDNDEEDDEEAQSEGSEGLREDKGG
jgi:hypothetical protein